MKRKKSSRPLRAATSLALVLAAAGLCLQGATARAARSAASPAAAPAPSQPMWIYPVIKGFGGVHPRPHLSPRPDPSVNYRIFVDVVSDERDPAGRYEALQRLARLVNLMAYAKVPADHVHIVALLDGATGWAAMSEAFSRKQFHADNPNLPLLHALRRAGVDLLVCGQALAEHDLPDSAVTPDVTITLSALTDAVVYGRRGYIYMRL